MINDAIDYVLRETAAYLGIGEAEVFAGNIHTLKDNGQKLGLYLSLVNVEEETTLKNSSHFVRENNDTRYKQPPVYLNLYLLFAFNFQNYGTSLLRLSQAAELFQSKPSFSAANAAVAFPATLERLVFEFHNLNLEQANHLWGVLGGTYLPSLLYKVRLVRVQKDETRDAPEIETVEVNSKEKLPSE